MPDTFRIRELYGRLNEDKLRKTTPVSADIAKAHEILFWPFSRFVDRRDIIARWIQRHQPCVFGKIAAAKNWMHYCIVTDQDLQRSDEHIANLVNRELLRWKQRSVRPTPEFSIPAHGFMLLVASPRVANASPDNNLLDLAQAFLALLRQEGSDQVHWQSLFLAHPKEKRALKFSFTVDYFGTQADGRWWHDHRVPGGIAFTANSVGHMKWFAEWYEQPRKSDWHIRLAMETIADSAVTPYGRATWLKSLPESGEPVVARLLPPFENRESLKASIRDKDWTRYGGFLHTDHAVRPEFFHESPSPDGIDFQSHLQDFAYLYDPTSKDYVRFVSGEEVSLEEVYAVIGAPETFTEIQTPQIQAEIDERPAYLQSLFDQCDDWQLSPNDLAEMLK